MRKHDVIHKPEVYTIVVRGGPSPGHMWHGQKIWFGITWFLPAACTQRNTPVFWLLRSDFYGFRPAGLFYIHQLLHAKFHHHRCKVSRGHIWFPIKRLVHVKQDRNKTLKVSELRLISIYSHVEKYSRGKLVSANRVASPGRVISSSDCDISCFYRLIGRLTPPTFVAAFCVTCRSRISHSLQLCFYILYSYVAKFKEVTWPWTRPFWVNISFMHY